MRKRKQASKRARERASQQASKQANSFGVSRGLIEASAQAWCVAGVNRSKCASASKQASKRARKQARKQASKHASKPKIEQASEKANSFGLSRGFIEACGNRSSPPSKSSRNRVRTPPKSTQNRVRRPSGPFGRLKSSLGPFQSSFKSAQERPRRGRDVPKTAPRRLKTPQDVPRQPENRAKTPPRALPKRVRRLIEARTAPRTQVGSVSASISCSCQMLRCAKIIAPANVLYTSQHGERRGCSEPCRTTKQPLGPPKSAARATQIDAKSPQIELKSLQDRSKWARMACRSG